MRLFTPRVVVFAALLSAGPAAVATAAGPMGAGFTYQGQLKDQGLPLTGDVDLRFSLVDVEVGGAPFGELNLADVAVANGLFSVQLDFGANVFNGNPRWLEVAVRFPHDPSDTLPFTTLTPRHAITATPYALHTRGLFVDDVGNVGIGTASSGEKLEIDGNIRATGAITSGSSIIIDGTGANGIMNNSSGDLILQTGGVSRVYIDSSFGSVGIGTTTPHNAMLDVVSGVTARAFGAINIASDLSLRIGVDGEAVAIHGVGVHGAATSTSGTNKGVWGRTESPDGFAAYFTGVSGSKNYFQRNVGIGTDSPIYPLHVEANANKAVFGKTTATTGTAYGGYFHSDAPTGVGVFGYGWNATGKNYGVRGQSRSTNGTGVYGWALATSGTNYGIYGETRSSTGYAGYFKGGRNYFEGNVGIGTTNPGAKLQLGGTNANLLMYESGGSPFVAVGDSNTTVGWLQWNSGGNELDVYTFGHDFPIAIGPTSVGGVFVDTDSNGGNVGIGTESPSFKLHVNGSAGKPGGGSWTNSSDRRLKKNIRDLTGSLDRLMKLRSVTFEYKDPDAINELHGERIGMIAQEVEEVFPDWVSVGGHGYKTLTFRGFEALTVEALRELRAEKDAQIDVLRRENVAMQERVARLEHLLLAKEEATR